MNQQARPDGKLLSLTRSILRKYHGPRRNAAASSSSSSSSSSSTGSAGGGSGGGGQWLWHQHRTATAAAAESSDSGGGDDWLHLSPFGSGHHHHHGATLSFHGSLWRIQHVWYPHLKQSVNSTLWPSDLFSLCAQYIQGSRAVLNESLRILADSRSSSPPSGGNKIKARLNNSDRVYRVVMVSGKRRCL